MAHKFPIPPRELMGLSKPVAMYFQKLQEFLNTQYDLGWDQIDFTGSDLKDIVTRLHNDLQSIQGGTTDEYYHLTSAEYVGLALLSTLVIDVDKDWNSKDITNIDNVEAATGEFGPLTLTGAVPLTATDTVWEDLRIPISAVRIGSAFPPDWVSFTGGLFVLGFDDGVNEEQVYFTAQIPHNYKIGGDIEAHVHWGPSDTNAGNVIWCLEYSIANIGDTFPSSTIITSAATATTLTANDHIYTDIGSIDVSGITAVTDISTMLICRLYRNSSNAADTYASDALLYEIDFHYEIDTLGSQDELSK